MIGGPGRCTGGGSCRPGGIWKNDPSYPRSPVHSARIAAMYSSARAPRCAMSAPDPVNSSGSQPFPIPRSSRPPDSTSTVAACLAISSGEANGWLTTATPSLIEEVAEARYPSVTIGSSTDR